MFMTRNSRFRRRREGVTDYRKRLAMVKSGMDRVTVRKSNRRIIGQVIKYEREGDRVLAAVDSNELVRMDWPSRGNRPTAYLAGLLLARKANKLKEKEMILDIGLASPIKGSIPFVFAKGCVDGGLKLKGKFEIDEKSYNSSATGAYAEELKKRGNAINFAVYAKKGVSASSLPELFNKTKEKILKS